MTTDPTEFDDMASSSGSPDGMPMPSSDPSVPSDSPFETSSGVFSSEFGDSLWEWDGQAWSLKEDNTLPGGVLQEPIVPGEFDGQLRSILSIEAV